METMKQVCKLWKIKVTSSSGILKTLIYHIVIEHFLERENWEAFKFHLNDFSYFEMSAPLFKEPPSNNRHTFKIENWIREQTLIWGNTVIYIYLTCFRGLTTRDTNGRDPYFKKVERNICKRLIIWSNKKVCIQLSVKR